MCWNTEGVKSVGIEEGTRLPLACFLLVKIYNEDLNSKLQYLKVVNPEAADFPIYHGPMAFILLYDFFFNIACTSFLIIIVNID